MLVSWKGVRFFLASDPQLHLCLFVKKISLSNIFSKSYKVSFFIYS